MVEIRLASNILKLVLKDGKNYVDAVDEIFPNERTTFQASNISVALAKEAWQASTQGRGFHRLDH